MKLEYKNFTLVKMKMIVIWFFR